MAKTETDTSLIKNSGLLDTRLKLETQPDLIYPREKQISELKKTFDNFFDDDIHVMRPRIVRGAPGTGKTTIVRYLAYKSFKEYDGDGKKIVYVPCNQYNTKRKTLNKIYYSIAQKSKENVCVGDIKEQIEQEGNDVMVVLDEFDKIMIGRGKSANIFHSLLRLSGAFSGADLSNINKETPNITFGLIGITNVFNINKYFPLEIKSYLGGSDYVKFPYYDAKELKEIMVLRARKAIKDRAWDEGTLFNIATKLVNQRGERGDAREAIKALRNAVELAEERGKAKIKEQEVSDGVDKVMVDKLYDEIKEYKVTGNLILFSILRLYKVKKEKNEGIDEFIKPTIKSTEIYNEYREIVNTNIGENEAVSERQVRNYIGDFIKSRFLRESASKGRAREVTLIEDVDLLEDAVGRFLEEEIGMYFEGKIRV